MVNRRRKHITKEDGEHHSLRIAGIHHTDDDGHCTDEEAVYVLTRCCATRGHRVGSHKYSTEGEATHHEVVPPFHRRACALEEKCQSSTTQEDAQHGAPRGDARPKQQDGTKGDSNDASLADRTRNEAANHVADRSVGGNALTNLSKRCSSCKAVGQRVAKPEDAVLSHPNLVTCHLRRIGEKQEHTGCDGGIEDVHTRTTEYLLTEDN